jgi:hypothetical protein
MKTLSLTEDRYNGVNGIENGVVETLELPDKKIFF